MTYIWEEDDWPRALFEAPSPECLALEVAAKNELLRLAGFTKGLSQTSRAMTEARLITDEGIGSNEVEGIMMSRDSFFASALRRKGLIPTQQIDRNHAPIIDALLDAIENANDAITAETLHRWQEASIAGANPFDTTLRGAFRYQADDMQIVTPTPMGKPDIVHYQAPPSDRVESEIDHMLKWIESDQTAPSLRNATLAHLWFETIHPYEDGNGRTGRLLWDRLVARASHDVIGLAGRWWTLSHEIMREKSAYYDALNGAQKGELSIDEFCQWGIQAITRSIDRTLTVGQDVVRSEELMALAGRANLNIRQKEILELLIKHGRDGLKQGMTNRRYMKTTRCSDATASRDLADLVDQGFLRPEGQGRARVYHVKWDKNPADIN